MIDPFIPLQRSTVADPERFDADPDLTFHAEANQAPDPIWQICLAREKTLFSQNLTKHYICNFLSNNTVRGVRGEERGIRGEG